MSPTIVLKRQNTLKIRAQFFQPDGVTPLDITTWLASFVVRTQPGPTSEHVDNLSDPTVLIVKVNTTHSDPTRGITEFTLNSDDTDKDPGTYFYACQATDRSSDPAEVVEGPTGEIDITADIVRAR